jgi:hypothetical protein
MGAVSGHAVCPERGHGDSHRDQMDSVRSIVGAPGNAGGVGYGLSCGSKRARELGEHVKAIGA